MSDMLGQGESCFIILELSARSLRFGREFYKVLAVLEHEGPVSVLAPCILRVILQILRYRILVFYAVSVPRPAMTT